MCRKPSSPVPAQENALWLLKKRAVNPDWDIAMGPYWESLPRQGELMTKETFPRSSLSLLQDDSLVPLPCSLFSCRLLFQPVVVMPVV